MLTASLDAATLADAVQKAARCAPVKGEAFDKAAGLLFNVDPPNGSVEIMATNLDVTYFHTLRMFDVSGDMAPVLWRLPSSLMANIFTSLELSNGEAVTFYDREDTTVRMSAGTTKARFQTYDDAGTYPDIKRKLDGSFSSAHDFGIRAGQVAWATDPSSARLGGVHIDGATLVATNSFQSAEVPCVVPIDSPVTVPVQGIEGLLAKGSDVRVQVAAKRLIINLDAESQLQARVLTEEFPDISSIKRDNFLGTISIHRETFTRVIERIFAMSRTERELSDLRITVDGTSMLPRLVLDVEVENVGRVQDSLEVTTDFTDEFTCCVAPEFFRQAVESSKEAMVQFRFGPGDMEHLCASDGAGYESWFSPKKPRKAT